MSLAAIALADTGIVVLTEDGTVVGPSPGMALIDGGSVTIGGEAAERHRLLPRRIHDRYWDRLDAEPLARPYPSHLSAADLAHTQLVNLWSRLARPASAVLIAAPGFFNRHQLGLVLGIADAAAVPVRGMVDSAVSSAVTVSAGHKTVIHVDILLHRVVVTRLRVDRWVERVSVETDESVGLLALRDAWAGAISSRFVRATRFDPLKLAATEQQLYDLIPRLTARARRESVVDLRMNAGGREFAIELPTEDLEGAGAGPVRRIVDRVRRIRADTTPALLLSHTAACTPGLERLLLADVSESVTAAEPLAPVRGALRASEQIMTSTSQVAFVSRLPVPEISAERHHESSS